MNLNYFVTVLRVTEGADDGYGHFPETWNAFCTTWADKHDVSDAELVAAGQEYSLTVSRFRVPWDPDTATITGNDRLEYEGQWNVRRVKELERNRWLEITAEKRSD